MKEIQISDATWEKLKATCGSRGIDETLLSLLNKNPEYPKISFTPKYLENEIRERCDFRNSPIHSNVDIDSYFDKEIEASLELEDGTLIFSRSMPLYDSLKNQDLEWGIKNRTLKRWKERKIRSLDFRVIEKLEDKIKLEGIEITFQSSFLSHNLGLKHKDFLSLEPVISISLNNRYSYQFSIKFKNENYPDYEFALKNKENTYTLKYVTLLRNNSAVIENENIIQALKFAFLAKILNKKIEETTGMKITLNGTKEIIIKETGKENLELHVDKKYYLALQTLEKHRIRKIRKKEETNSLLISINGPDHKVAPISKSVTI